MYSSIFRQKRSSQAIFTALNWDPALEGAVPTGDDDCCIGQHVCWVSAGQTFVLLWPTLDFGRRGITVLGGPCWRLNIPSIPRGSAWGGELWVGVEPRYKAIGGLNICVCVCAVHIKLIFAPILNIHRAPSVLVPLPPPTRDELCGRKLQSRATHCKYT